MLCISFALGLCRKPLAGDSECQISEVGEISPRLSGVSPLVVCSHPSVTMPAFTDDLLAINSSFKAFLMRVSPRRHRLPRFSSVGQDVGCFPLAPFCQEVSLDFLSRASPIAQSRRPGISDSRGRRSCHDFLASLFSRSASHVISVGFRSLPLQHNASRRRKRRRSDLTSA